MAGPVELPAEIAALVALDEVTVHAWDLARATGQAYDADPSRGRGLPGFAESFEPPAGRCADDGGLFGPPVAVPTTLHALDRLLGATGRDPAWSPDRPIQPPDFVESPSLRYISPAVACPSGLRSTPRKRVWVQAHRGFKSHRHRQPNAPDPWSGAFVVSGGSYGRRACGYRTAMSDQNPEHTGRLDDEAEATEQSDTTDGPAAEGEYDPGRARPTAVRTRRATTRSRTPDGRTP